MRPAALAAALAAAVLIAACGSSKSGPIDAKIPGGYTKVTEAVGADSFSLAVPGAWRSSTSHHGDATLELFSPGGVSPDNRTALERQRGLVLIGWTPNTSVSVDQEISQLESAAASLKHLHSTVTRVYLTGTAESKILDQSYTASDGRPGSSSTLVVATNHGGLIDIEAIQSANTSGFTPAETIDAFHFQR